MTSVEQHPNPALRPAPGTVPDTPGVYRFETADGTAVYVGKARSLRKRIASYFRDHEKLHPRTRAMLSAAQQLRWVVCATETEALVLERSWIAAEQPRFNVALRNGDGYPGIAVETAPVRVRPWRGRRPSKAVTFGPYPNASLRELLDALARVFQVRSCNDSTYRRAERRGQPCLLADLGRCSAPCVGRVSSEQHQDQARTLIEFLSGTDRGVLARIEKEMVDAAEKQSYEQAARRRDELHGLRRVLEQQSAAVGVADCDVIAIHETAELVGVAVVEVRNQEVRGVRSFLADADPETTGADRWAQLVGAALADTVVWAPVVVLGVDTVPDGVSEMLSSAAGTAISVRRARRREAGLVGMAIRNAESAVANGVLRKPQDVLHRSAALDELADALGLLHSPWRVECLDISHTQGRQPVASLVVSEGGEARYSEYRRVSLPAELGGDDPASLAYAITKRFTGSRLGLSAHPDIVLVDGGPVQAAAVSTALHALFGTASSPRPPFVVGLAKRMEELWPAGEETPVILDRRSPALLLAQAVRDEAHRWAITGHRNRRDRAALSGRLDTVAGLGPKRRSALLARFGGVHGVLDASPAELGTVAGIGPALAKRIHDTLHPQP